MNAIELPTDIEIKEMMTSTHFHYEKGHYRKVRLDRIQGGKMVRDLIKKRLEAYAKQQGENKKRSVTGKATFPKDSRFRYAGLTLPIIDLISNNKWDGKEYKLSLIGTEWEEQKYTVIFESDLTDVVLDHEEETYANQQGEVPTDEEIENESSNHKEADITDNTTVAHWDGYEKGFIKSAKWVRQFKSAEQQKRIEVLEDEAAKWKRMYYNRTV